MVIISGCLVGIDCRYDGGSFLEQELIQMMMEGKAVVVCPEQLGGMSTPRLPCEIVDGDGNDVLEGKARVYNRAGEETTAFFLKGAEETLKIAKLCGAEAAILKARSPSCGKSQIYDGSFSKTLRAGDGVAAALLKKNGILVFDEENFREYIK